MLSPLSVIKLPVLLSFYFISSFAQAQIFSTAATAGSAGAGRAAVEAGDVNYLNPAALVHVRGRSIFSTFSKDDLSVGLSETSRDVILPASFSYYQNKIESPAHLIQTQEQRLSIADFIVEKASIGLTGILNSTKLDGQSYSQTNGNIGLFYTPSSVFGMGWVFYNVFNPRDEIPEEIRFQRKMGAGFNYIFRGFMRYRLDVVSAPNNDFGKATYLTGFESFLNEWVMVRLGYKYDVLAAQEMITEGFGFRGPVFSLHYAHEGAFRGPDFDRHSIDLSISF